MPANDDLGPRRSPAPKMEGRMARWYARQRASAPQLQAVKDLAGRLTGDLPAGAEVLEVAPGPGYLAIELARRGCTVTGLDISRTFVEIAAEHAGRAGVPVAFVRGDAAALPFDAGCFDLIVCQAAFKNFGRPLAVLGEMHRVLRAGRSAVIEDLNKDATGADIDEEVAAMRLGRLNSFLTKVPLKTMLRRRAYSSAEFERLAAESAFPAYEISTTGVDLVVRLTKAAGT
jgi:ubiquinone/menaquinone biosynthesis C-methylase UbiE